MDNNSLAAELELIKDKYPSLYNEYKCFDYIVENYSENIADAYFRCGPGEIPCIIVENPELFYLESPFTERLGFGVVSLEYLKKKFWEYGFIRNSEDEFLSFCNIPGKILVFCEWLWGENASDYVGDMSTQPSQHLGRVPTPFRWETPKPSHSEAPKIKKPLEKKLEDDLLKWLHSRGIKADNQVSTSKHRLDIWLPGVAFLELKRDKVTGDDVCQAIDYCSEYKKPVILVGNHIGTVALRGAEAFNRAIDSEMLIYVPWSAVKTYLKGLLGIH